jgi:chitinase
MVGAPEDVQSFDKRDGSRLELFDCPDTEADDFSLQKLRAVCIGETEDGNNCEDILLGGVEGTVVRLPSYCGPDDYVRAVKFESSANSTIPGHLSKRQGATKVYDLYYDYEFANLRRDGGEVYFRADVSTHPGYWNYMVKAKHGASAKRSADTWRELDKRYWSETKSDWLKRFNALLKTNHRGLKKHYEFNQCLFETSAVCGKADATMKASVYGELNTTMDLGMSLIGTLRNFGFSEAYAFFSQEEFAMRMGTAFRARARMYMDSGWVPIGSFDSFGMNSYIKAIFTFNPSFKMDARLEADAYVSAQATTEMTISHDQFQYYLPVDLSNNPVSVVGDFKFDTVTGPISGFGDINAQAGGGLVFGFRPTIGVDIGVQLGKKKYVDTSVSLSTPSSLRYDVSLSTSCSEGLQFDVTGQMGMNFSVENALPGWKSD